MMTFTDLKSHMEHFHRPEMAPWQKKLLRWFLLGVVVVDLVHVGGTAADAAFFWLALSRLD